jgi:hypothetical protein
VLAFLKSRPADFTIREDGVVRLNPEFGARSGTLGSLNSRQAPTVSRKAGRQIPEIDPASGCSRRLLATALRADLLGRGFHHTRLAPEPERLR